MRLESTAVLSRSQANRSKQNWDNTRSTAMKLLFTLLCVMLAAGSSVQMSNKTTAAAPDYDVLITNGAVIDGSGRSRFNADVGIKGDRIAKIGNLRGATATRTVDARGMVVAPGFIDMLGQSEQYVLIDPRAMSKVM